MTRPLLGQPGQPGRSALSVRTITEAEHLSHLETQRAASFLQTPAWAGEERVAPRVPGWFRTAGGELVGVGLVLYRQLPKLKRSLAYLPEGPVIDWADRRPGRAGWTR